MKNYIQKNPGMSFVALIVIIIVIAALVHGLNKESPLPASSGDMNGPSTSTDMTSSSTPEAVITEAPLAYSVYVATSTFGQNQIIHITVSVLNLTDASTTLSFKDGCAGDYTIGSFDMIKHTTCLSSPSSIIVPPHGIRQIGLVHYPTVYQIPVGNYTLHAFFVGYGGNSVPITITQ